MKKQLRHSRPSPLRLDGDPANATEREREQRRRRQVMTADGNDSPGRCMSCGRTAGMVSGASSFGYVCSYCDGARN